MSEKLNSEIKKPNELDIDLENNQRALNRDIGKFKPVDGYYTDNNQTNIVNETKDNNQTNIVNETKEDGFDYEKKYINEEKNDSTEEEIEISSKNEDNDENSSGTILNPRLEQITEPDPDDKKRTHHLSSINKRNRNQPL